MTLRRSLGVATPADRPAGAARFRGDAQLVLEAIGSRRCAMTPKDWFRPEWQPRAVTDSLMMCVLAKGLGETVASVGRRSRRIGAG